MVNRYHKAKKYIIDQTMRDTPCPTIRYIVHQQLPEPPPHDYHTTAQSTPNQKRSKIHNLDRPTQNHKLTFKAPTTSRFCPKYVRNARSQTPFARVFAVGVITLAQDLRRKWMSRTSCCTPKLTEMSMRRAGFHELLKGRSICLICTSEPKPSLSPFRLPTLV